jgi:lipopolysaccharide transport system ATP-binding protein
MKVRLAFAVAAHLEPDILIVDEVLAVGDAEFQKKAIGKMQDISKEGGRTVLFVSHDMDAMLKLTSRIILLENGMVLNEGEPQYIINKYTLVNFKPEINNNWEDGKELGNSFAKLKSVSVTNTKNIPQFEYDINEDIHINICYLDLNDKQKNTAIIHIIDEQDRTLFASNEFDATDWAAYHNEEDSMIKATCLIPGNLLLTGRYKVLIAVGNYNPNMIHVKIDNALTFSVIDKPTIVRPKTYIENWPGLVRPLLKWEIQANKIKIYGN